MSPQLKTETTGCLRLTPEQLKDLRMVLDNFGRHSITSDMTTAAERLADALFPATEPTEDLRVHNHTPYRGSGPDGHCAERTENGRLRGQCMTDIAPTVGRCPKELEGDIESFPCVLSAGHRDRHKSAGGLTWGYITPAEPAEEDAKAEAQQLRDLSTALRAALGILDPLEGEGWLHAWRTADDLDDCANRISPSVVPATETGRRTVNTTVLAEVLDERVRQDAKWGEQNHPDVDQVLMTREGGVSPSRMAEHYELPTAERAKLLCDAAARFGSITYAHILIEEVAEVVEAATRANVPELRDELIQVAAVAVAWVEKLDWSHSRSNAIPASSPACIAGTSFTRT